MDPFDTRAKNLVCVIDDDEAVADSLTLLLDLAGFEAAGYVSPTTFLRELRDGELQVNCAIIDYHMPEMDGLSLLREIRRQRLDLPVIVMSGRGAADIERQALALGAVAYFDKPLTRHLLLAAIDEALRAPPGVSRVAS